MKSETFVTTAVQLSRSRKSHIGLVGLEGVARLPLTNGTSTHAVRIVLALATFYVAKSIASGGNVALDQFEIWILACLPLGMFELFERLYNWAAKEEAKQIARIELLDSWTVSVALLVVLRSSFFADAIERPIYQSLDYNFQLFNALISVVYVALGTMLVHLAKRLMGWPRSHSLMHIVAGLLLQSAAFYAFIFVMPPTNF